jgi:hypothetical protein
VENVGGLRAPTPSFGPAVRMAGAWGWVLELDPPRLQAGVGYV